MKVLINGIEQDYISVFDRGFAYGDGLFETMRITHGRIPLLDLHLDRLQRSCSRLGIPYPGDAVLQQESADLSQIFPEAILKIIVTRGVSGQRGYAPTAAGDPTRILIASVYATDTNVHAEQGIEAILCQHRLACNPVLAGMKRLGMLEYVLAAAEIQSAAVQEGILRDMDERVIEGTRTNLFLIRHNVLYTPNLANSGVEGVMRNRLLSIAKTLGIHTEILYVDIAMLASAEEVFVANAILGIWPVRKIEQMTFQIGRMTRRLQTEVNEIFAA